MLQHLHVGFWSSAAATEGGLCLLTKPSAGEKRQSCLKQLSSIQCLHAGIPSVVAVFLETDSEPPTFRNRVEILVAVVFMHELEIHSQ